MTTPTYCSACGHELGIGRFCTNCGRPVPGRHPEAAPPAAAPPPPPAEPAPPAGPAPVTVATPPPTGQLPPAARYPLYADSPPTGPPVPPPTPPATERRAGPPWLPWVAALLVLVVIAGLGAFLLVGSGEDDPTVEDRDDAASSTPSDRRSGDEPTRPDSDGTGAPAPQPEPGEVVDLTTDLSARVPATAPPSRDRQGRPVDFAAANMWDGDPRTAWRMPGDGTGRTLTFDLGRDVVLTEVGLVNGYAKIDGPNNWYRGNRRVLAVQWEFDDGTRITQDLDQRRSLQTIPIDPVASRTVTVNLLTVTEPGTGPSGRDFTAISEVHLRGAPA